MLWLAPFRVSPACLWVIHWTRFVYEWRPWAAGNLVCTNPNPRLGIAESVRHRCGDNWRQFGCCCVCAWSCGMLPGWRIAKTLVATEGVGGLFRGIVSPLFAVGLASTLAFSSNETAKVYLVSRVDHDDRLALFGALFASGCIGGFVVSCVSTPSTFIKIQLQTMASREAASHPLRTSVRIAREVWRTQGIRGFYHGHRLQVLMECLGRGLYFSVYEVFKTALGIQPPYPSSSPSSSSSSWTSPTSTLPTTTSSLSTSPASTQADAHAPPSFALRLVAAAGSGCTMWTVLYPLDVARSHYMMSNDHSSILGTVRKVYSAHGVIGFYRGLSVTLFRAVPVAVTVLPTFDYVRDKLRLWLL